MKNYITHILLISLLHFGVNTSCFAAKEASSDLDSFATWLSSNLRGNPRDVLLTGKLYEKQALKQDSTRHLVQAINFQGIAYQFLNQMDSSIELHHQALELTKKHQYEALEGKTLKVLGNAFYRKGSEDSCIAYFLKAKTLAKKLKNEDEIISITHNLGVLYSSVGLYEKSLASFNEVLAFAKESGDSARQLGVYNSIANVFYKSKDEGYDSINYYYQKALRIAEDLNIPFQICNLNSNLALLNSNQYEEGKEELYLNKSYSYAQTAFKYLDEATPFHMRYQVYYILGLSGARLDKPNHMRHLDSAYSIAQESKNYYNIRSVSEALMRETFLGNNRKVGDAYLFEFRNAYDSINKETRLQAIFEAEAKYETDQTRLENEKLAAENEVTKLQLNRLVLALVCLVALFLVGFLLYRNRLKKKTIELKSQEVHFKNKLIQSNMEIEENERKRIARELHDGVGQQISSIKLGLENVDQSQQKTNVSIEELKDMVTNVLHSVRGISHQMMPVALQRFGLIKALDSLIDFMNENSNVDFSFENFNASEIKLQDTTEIHLYRIVQELTNNVLKHAKANKCEVQVHKQEGKLIISVSDDGIGMEANNVAPGMGLININTRADAIDATIHTTSDKNGTTIVISLVGQ